MFGKLKSGKTALMAAPVAALAFLSNAAYAISATDLTQDTSGGKTLTDVMDNSNNLIGVGATLLLAVFSLIGLVLIATSLLSLHRAAKEERERPGGAIAGIIIGGLLLGVSIIAFVIRNSLLGT